MTYTNEELKEILRLHSLWLNGDKGGKRADLSGADLNGADLRRANLRGADMSAVNLSKANLYGANLYGADLCEANLYGANLVRAYLCKVNLYNANLSNADLRNADLSDANLSGTNLCYAYLGRANLCGADFRGTNLAGADIYKTDFTNIKTNETTSGYFQVCPEKGSYIGYKKCSQGRIVELLIPEDALRSSATTRKCRASKAKVLSITSIDGTESFDVAASSYDDSFIYRVGEMVEVPDFDVNRWKECSTGIHHFITRKEAVLY